MRKCVSWPMHNELWSTLQSNGVSATNVRPLELWLGARCVQWPFDKTRINLAEHHFCAILTLLKFEEWPECWGRCKKAKQWCCPSRGFCLVAFHCCRNRYTNFKRIQTLVQVLGRCKRGWFLLKKLYIHIEVLFFFFLGNSQAMSTSYEPQHNEPRRVILGKRGSRALVNSAKISRVIVPHKIWFMLSKCNESETRCKEKFYISFWRVGLL